MTGAVRKRGSTWSYYFDLGTFDGKRKKKEKGGFKTKKEAQEALAQALFEYLHTGEVFSPSQKTLHDFLNEWFDSYCVTNLKYNTQICYLRIIRLHLQPSLGKCRLKALTPYILQQYAYELKTQGYAKSHIVSIMIILQSALNYAVQPMHYLNFNPMLQVKIPRIERKPRQRIILSLEDWENIIQRFPVGNRFHIPLMIGFYTGLRISEVFALTWDDIDFENHSLTVNKQVIKRNYGSDIRKAVEKGRQRTQSCWYFATTKTASSERTIKFGEALCDALAREKKRQQENERIRAIAYTTQHTEKEKDEKGNDMVHIVQGKVYDRIPLPRLPMVCVDETGEYSTTDSFKYCSRVIHNELNLKFDFHSLRHTHATLLIEAGASVKSVQTRLGHSNITTTLQTYVHDTDKMSDESVQLFELVTTRKI